MNSIDYCDDIVSNENVSDCYDGDLCRWQRIIIGMAYTISKREVTSQLLRSNLRLLKIKLGPFQFTSHEFFAYSTVFVFIGAYLG